MKKLATTIGLLLFYLGGYFYGIEASLAALDTEKYDRLLKAAEHGKVKAQIKLGKIEVV